MAQSLRLRRGLRKLQQVLLVAAVALALVGVLLGFFGPVEGAEDRWLSAGVGTAAGLLLVLVTGLASKLAVRDSGLSVGWVAIDYLVKAAVVIAVLLVARAVSALSPVIVGLLLVGAIVFTAGAQVFAFVTTQPKPKTEIQ